jgi:hypothetical protein
MNKCLCGIVVVVLVLAICSAGFAQDEYRTMVEDSKLTHLKAMQTINSMVVEIHDLYSDQPEFLATFDASQKAWEKYQRLHIQALYPEGRENYGSSFNLCGPMESLRLAKERINLIKQWIIGTIEGDVCCGTIRWVSVEEYEKATGQEIPTTD